MIFILLSILLNSYVGIIFKLFEKYKINNTSAIVINYWLCVITGSIFHGSFPLKTQTINEPWSIYAIILGTLFIIIFNLIAISSVKVGITVTQVSNKLSFVIPVVFSLLFYSNEEFNMLKLLGILTALTAVWLSTTTGDEKNPKESSSMLFVLPLLIFFGSGTIDIFTKYVQFNFIPSQNSSLLNTYVISTFFIAAMLGLFFLLYEIIFKGKKVQLRDVIAGFLLGIPNYFSIYFLIKALQYDGLSSSAIIPINNIGIVACVSLIGVFFFKEKLNLKNKLGLVLSIVAIILIYMAG